MNSKTIILIATLLACTNAIAQNVDEALKAFSKKRMLQMLMCSLMHCIRKIS